MSYVKGLKCRECARAYPKDALYVCEYCFGPLEVDYDYEAIGKKLTKEVIEARPGFAMGPGGSPACTYVL